MQEGFDKVKGWLHLILQTFQKKWQAGLQLTVDETMVFWVGIAEGKLMFLPRKPTPLGFMLKTLVDTVSGVLLNAEIVEGVEKDTNKEYNGVWGKSTGCTLRLCRPWHGKARVIIADSWFGSYKTAVALLKHGCFVVANVKTGHKHFPKTKLKGIVKKRGDTHHMKIIVPGMENTQANEVYASIH